MSDTTLKPCPFCGSQCFFNHEDATDARGDEYVRAWVECTGCDMRSIAKRAAYGIPAVKVMLAELWNRRVTTHQAVDVDAICNAYESGVGHRGRPTANVNPYRECTPEHEAYAIGAKGEAEAKVADVNAVALAWQEGYAQGHNDGLGCGHPLATRCNHNPGAEWVQSDTYDALLAAKAKGGGA